MPEPNALRRSAEPQTRMGWLATTSQKIHPLVSEQTGEALAFLARRPLHTVFMAGMIRDNGLVSRLNRGSFYACRDARGALEGVALIGHATLVEARTEGSLVAFARLAQGYGRAHVIMGESERVGRFWDHYAGDGQEQRVACRELLLAQRWPVEAREPVPALRPATLEHLAEVMRVQAQLAFEESGVSPLETDPAGFRARCARRIEQGRVWVLAADDRLIFKIDVMSQTPEAVYLEGLFVHPEERGKGYGLRCMSQLGRSLLGRSGSICVLVNEQNQVAQALYRKSRYQCRGFYDTIFLQQEN